MATNSFKTNRVQTHNKIKSGKVAYFAFKPVFSFCDYIVDDNYFSAEDANEPRHCLYKFFENLNKFSKTTWGDMRSNPQVYHFHPMDDNISALARFNSCDLEQFKVPGMKHGRFIGFFDKDAVFHILLYDARHQAYKRK